MLEQTKRAIIYIKTFVPTFTIPEDLETIEIWDKTLKDYEMTQLECILYWARKDKDFKFAPLDVIDKTGQEYKACQEKYKKQKETAAYVRSFNHEYTDEEKAKISEKIEEAKRKIMGHAAS